MSLLCLAAAALCACASNEEARLHALLVVVPSATDVNLEQRQVSYRVDDDYPASRTIKSLSAALTLKQCRASERDPFDRDPGASLRRWTEYIPDEGGASTLVWSGAWVCPSEDVVVFGLRTTRESTKGSSMQLEIEGLALSAKNVEVFRDYVGSGGGSPGRPVFSKSNPRRGAHYQTCARCGSTRKQANDGRWAILYANPAATPHDHRWEDGVHSGLEVSNGRIVLVRRKVALDEPAYVYGAFVMDSHIDPKEEVDYHWILRTDGGGDLSPAAGVVAEGSSKAQHRVSFGPFRIPWSGNRPERGYVYYPRFTGSGRSSEDWELCLTELTSFAGIDAAHPQFVYKSSPVD